MARGKTAAMFAAPFAIGALLGGAPDAHVAALHDFGEQVGLAFQAVDDVLGIWGDEAVTGKPVGDDLRSRKMTLPVIVAIEAGGDEADRLAAAYATPGAPGDDVTELAELVERLGGRTATERFAEERVGAALGALSAVGLSAEALDACSQFAGAAAGRKF
jgi:geranylgeranyl diphosphate synthase type I